MTKRTIAVLPARYGSTRFPGKPLALISGKPMIQWCYESTSKCKELDDVIVATDDKRIFDAVAAFGGKVVMTSPNHPTGTDRIAEAVKDIDADLIVNVQGDEPLMSAKVMTTLPPKAATASNIRLSSVATMTSSNSLHLLVDS